MPEKVDECVKSIREDNPDMSESRAYAICNAMQNRGELSVDEDASHEELLRAAAEHDGKCPEGQVWTGDSCASIEEVADVPPGALDLSVPRVMASAARLDTQPIEREELSDGKVAYRNIKLVDSGVWTDQNSQTPTLYDERTFENTNPEFDSRAYDGPPVNIAHDIHKDGPNAGEPHVASIGGYIDPDSIRTDGNALFGDIILDTTDPAGAFADENLKSALENDGTAGFSPSVELMPTELREADHPHAEEHVAAADLTGLGLVRDPASKSVDLRHETQNRAVAMAAGGKGDKARVYERQLMSPDELREILDNYGFEGLDEMSDEDVLEVAGDLHEDLMGELGPEDGGGGGDGEGDGQEMEEHDGDGGGDDEDEEDDKDMQDGEAIGVLEEQIDDIWEAIEDLEDSMATGEEMSAELEDAKAELADADTVAELKEAKDELDKRLSSIENQEKERKTLADDGDPDFEPAYDDTPSSVSGW